MATQEPRSNPGSHYQAFLPALLQKDPVIDRFLQVFEQVLSGATAEGASFQPEVLTLSTDAQEASKLPGLGEVIRHIHLYLNPEAGYAPSEFLPWLAGWVALSLRDDWTDDAVKRNFIRKIVPLYKIRGTKPGLEKILGLYLESLNFDPKVTVYDEFEQYPNYFQVELTLPYPDPDQYSKQARIARAIVDQEKPAHTYYTLRILTPTMRITGRMIPFQFSSQTGSQTKRFRIQIAGSETYPVRLVVGLNAHSNLSSQTQPQVQELGQGASMEYRVEANPLPENAGWQMTLSREHESPEVTLKLASLEEMLYLSLNQLDRRVVEVHVSFDQETRSLTLHPALRLYEQYKTSKNPILKTGNTVIGTETGSVATQSSQSGA